MAGKLNARKVETLTEPGRYSDGGNLYLSITPNGGKRWVLPIGERPSRAARTTGTKWASVALVRPASH